MMSAAVAADAPVPACNGCGHGPGSHKKKPGRTCTYAAMCGCRGWNVPVKRIDAKCRDCGTPLRVVPEEVDDARCSTCMVREVRDSE